MNLPPMSPEEFVGRCIDAALRTQNDIATTVCGTTFEKIMSFDLKFGVPIEFHFMDNDFFVELSYREEMVHVTSEMVSCTGQYRATVVLSKITRRGLSHWTFHETAGDSKLMEEDMTLLTLATNDTLNIGNLICR